MGRSPCCPKEGLNRGAWTAHEDKVLKDYIRIHGEGRWRNLPKRAGLKRCGKSCRLRWLNYLRPDIKRGNISSDEEELIIRLHKLLGNRWSLIAGRLPGRTDNEIKNYWNTNLGKKVKEQQHSNNPSSTSSRRRFAPLQTNPPTLLITCSSPKLDDSNNSHLVRTKATKCSKVLLINPTPPPPPPPPPPHSSDVATEAKESDEFENGILSLLGGDAEKDLSTQDFLMDYDVVGDVSFSDLLNSDLCCDDDQHHPLVFSDEIFNDWTHSNLSQ